MLFEFQRKLEGDGRRWRTVTKFSEIDEAEITEIAKRLSKIGLIALRIVEDTPVQAELARWDFTLGGWVPT